jgi:pimeloyl-[acyl-carrier protein] methyl ester esterase
MKSDVVLLPGFHGSVALFSSFIALAPSWARCRPLALPNEGDQGFDALAEALLPELKPLEGFVLVGESFSGPIAARLAEVLGQKVALLVLCNPLVEIDLALPSGLAASILRSRMLPAWGAAVALTGGERALGTAALRELRLLSKKTLEGRLAAVFSATAGSLAAHLVAPLLTIVGSRDRLVSPQRALDVCSKVPRSTVVELDAPHLVIQTRPAEVWRAISEEFESAA